MKINDVDVSLQGLALQDCRISAPVRKRLWVPIPGGDGQMDLMEGTGPPRYEQRTVTMDFESTALSALPKLRQMLGTFEGCRVALQLPGYEEYTISGVFHLSGAVDRLIICTVLCDPWFICRWDNKRTVTGTSAGVDVQLQNNGVREAIPEFEVGSEVRIVSGDISVSLSPGKHLLPDFVIDGKSTRALKVYDGAVTIRYREAIL